MSMIKKFLPCLLILSSFVPAARADQKLNELIVKSGKASHKFTIEIADDDLEREKGLMFRESLDKSRGMLFVFKFEKEENFWMKDTLIPLDIIFIKKGGVIAKIHSMAKPKDLTLIPSGVPVIAALEIKGGEAKRRGLKAGDKVIYPLFQQAPKKG